MADGRQELLDGSGTGHMSMIEKITAALAMLFLTVMIVLAGTGLAHAEPFVEVPKFPIPTIVAIVAAAALGALAAWMIKPQGRASEDLGKAMILIPLPAMIAIAALMLLAYRSGVAAGQAAIGLLLAVLAMIAALRAFERLGKGEAIGFDSHWGGLGGGSSGWRISPVAGLAVLSLAFAGASLALVVIDPDAKSAAEQPADGKTVPAGAAGAAAGAAAGKEGEAKAGEAKAGEAEAGDGDGAPPSAGTAGKADGA